MIKTTCFGLFQPSSGFHPKEYQCLQDLCGCVTMVRSRHLWFLIITVIIKRSGQGGSVMWVLC